MRTRAMKGRFAGVAVIAAMSIGGAAAPASAQTQQDGLVNVSLTDTNVQVPIGIAANVCGVSANVLSSATLTSPVDCDAFAGATASREGGDGGSTKQSGLVNIALTDTNIQVPVGVAANICGISVNVLSGLIGQGPVECDATAWPRARNQ